LADDGLLRHTVFVGLREDKPAREVRLRWDAMPFCFSIRRDGTCPASSMCRAISRSCPSRPNVPSNPAEKVREFMRDNWLSNRVFLNADDLLDHCCEAWNKLRSQPWRLMSVGMREWAHKF
jgi:hypothetical protein